MNGVAQMNPQQQQMYLQQMSQNVSANAAEIGTTLTHDCRLDLPKTIRVIHHRTSAYDVILDLPQRALTPL